MHKLLRQYVDMSLPADKLSGKGVEVMSTRQTLYDVYPHKKGTQSVLGGEDLSEDTYSVALGHTRDLVRGGEVSLLAGAVAYPVHVRISLLLSLFGVHDML